MRQKAANSAQCCRIVVRAVNNKMDSCEAVLRRPKPPRISLSHVLHLRHFDAPGMVEL